MNKNIKQAIVNSIIFLALLWFLIPAGASWFFGRHSLIRFDPQKSKDYNCIFIEGHVRKSFQVPWLTRNTSLEYLRIRYTPHSDNQEYGIMFIDPKTMSYAAYPRCAKWPSHLEGHFDSPQAILDWIRSQPHAQQLSTHTNDANEVYAAIQELSKTDLQHFTLPKNFDLQNFRIGHQNIDDDQTPRFWDLLAFVPLWIIAFAKRKQDNKPT